MKTFLFTFTLIFTSLSFAKKEAVKVKMDLEQIWTFNSEELSQLPAKEKEEFTQSLLKEVESNKVLQTIPEVATAEKLKKALSSDEKWDAAEKKISGYCQDSHNYAACEKLAKIRTDLLFKYSPRK